MSKHATEIQQTLHGYSDGHRLLASSVQLSRSSERAMLPLTDYSGSSVVSGYEKYLTGYPVPYSDFYAFSKTWLAPEQKRPGCVWTHSLLIPKVEMSRFSNPDCLLCLFRKPKARSKKAFEEYEGPLTVSGSPYSGAPLMGSSDIINEFDSENILRAIIFLLYTQSEGPVFVPSDSAGEMQSLVLQTWFQQWSSLRTNFTFCTGSLSDRNVGGRSLDLQVVPNRISRRLASSVENASLLENGETNASPSYPSWVLLACENILDSRSSGLRDYFNLVGDSDLTQRSDYQKLTSVYCEARKMSMGVPELTTLLDAVGTNYPKMGSASQLKLALFGGVEDRQTVNLVSVGEADLLRFLSLAGDISALSAQGLHIRSRAHALWKNEQDAASRLILELVEEEVNSIGNELLKEFVNSVDANSIVRLAARIPGLLTVFVKSRPCLAADPQLWSISSEMQREVLETVFAEDASSDISDQMIHAMLQAGTGEMASFLYERLGRHAVHVCLSWMDVQPNDRIQLAQSWQSIIQRNPSDCIAWLKENHKPGLKTLAAIVPGLDPTSETMVAFKTGYWCRVVNSDTHTLSPEERLALADFLLALGFAQQNAEAGNLIVFGFDIVHAALARNALTYDSWSRLSAFLPTLSLFRSWDRCERLRRGLLRTFVEWDLAPAEFLRCTQDKTTFQQLISASDHVKGGRKFLRRTRSAVEDYDVLATPWQRKALANCL